MSPIDDAMDEPAGAAAGRALWRRCQATETAEDETERFLDLAAFVDGRIDDDDERSRVAARLAADPDAAGDVAAARAIAAGGVALPGGIEAVVARAVSLPGDLPEPARVVPFPARAPGRHGAGAAVGGVARWAGLAAAVAVAGWLGFAMGSGASLTLSQPAPAAPAGDGSFLSELLDPSTGFLHDLGEGRRT